MMVLMLSCKINILHLYLLKIYIYIFKMYICIYIYLLKMFTDDTKTSLPNFGPNSYRSMEDIYIKSLIFRC